MTRLFWLGQVLRSCVCFPVYYKPSGRNNQKGGYTEMKTNVLAWDGNLNAGDTG